MTSSDLFNMAQIRTIVVGLRIVYAPPQNSTLARDDRVRQRKLTAVRKLLTDVGNEADDLIRARRSFTSSLNEALVKRLPYGERGGIVVFPADAVGIEGNRTWDYAEWRVSFFDKPSGRVARVKKVLKDAGLIAAFSSGFTLGNHFHGRYRSGAASGFSERSKTLEILYLNRNELNEVATAMVKEFHLESVLVKEHATGEAYIVDRK